MKIFNRSAGILCMAASAVSLFLCINTVIQYYPYVKTHLQVNPASSILTGFTAGLFLLLLAAVVLLYLGSEFLTEDGNIARELVVPLVLLPIFTTASFFAMPKISMPPLFYAVYKNESAETINKLIAEKGSLEKKHDGYSIMEFAVTYSNNPETVKTLIKAGADVNETDDRDMTILMYAIKADTKPSVIRALLKEGAYINARRKDGSSALLLACSLVKNPEVINVLLENGADINATNKSEVNPILSSAMNIHEGKNEMMKILLQKGANVNSRTVEGSTPLMFAVYYGDLQSVKILVESGADVKAEDSEGRKLYDYLLSSRKTTRKQQEEIGSYLGISPKQTIGNTAR